MIISKKMSAAPFFLNFSRDQPLPPSFPDHNLKTRDLSLLNRDFEFFPN